MRTLPINSSMSIRICTTRSNTAQRCLIPSTQRNACWPTRHNANFTALTTLYQLPLFLTFPMFDFFHLVVRHNPVRGASSSDDDDNDDVIFILCSSSLVVVASPSNETQQPLVNYCTRHKSTATEPTNVTHRRDD